MPPELRRALDDVYAVFARYDAPDYLGLGGNFELRDLTVAQWHQFDEDHDLGVLFFSDNGEMLRAFLPRWLEWLIEEPALCDKLRYLELDDLGRRLTWNHWRDWPADEAAALNKLLAVWTRTELAEFGGAPPSAFPATLPVREQDWGEEGHQLGLIGFSV